MPTQQEILQQWQQHWHEPQKMKLWAINQTIQELDEQGKQGIAYLADIHGYQHRTHNLIDSYGYAVYYNRRPVRKGYATPSPQATEPNKGVWGRPMIQNFFNTQYTPTPGLELVLAAAMPYADEVEYKYHYHVMAESYAFLKTLWVQPPHATVLIRGGDAERVTQYSLI